MRKLLATLDREATHKRCLVVVTIGATILALFGHLIPAEAATAVNLGVTLIWIWR